MWSWGAPEYSKWNPGTPKTIPLDAKMIPKSAKMRPKGTKMGPQSVPIASRQPNLLFTVLPKANLNLSGSLRD